jgi:HEAT repeat protein
MALLAKKIRQNSALFSALCLLSVTWFSGCLKPEPQLSRKQEQVAELSRLVETADLEGKVAALCRLADLGQDGKAAVEGVLRATNDLDERVRLLAVRTLGRIGSCDDDSLLTLSVRLEDADSDVRVEAVRALARLCHRSDRVRGILLSALTHQDSRVARESACELIACSHERDTAIAVLIAKAQHVDPEIRADAVYSIRVLASKHHISARDRTIVQYLVMSLRDPDPLVRTYAAHSIRCLDEFPTESVPVLIELLEDPVRSVRVQAVNSIQKSGPAGRSAIPAILRYLREANLDEQQYCLQALAALKAGDED